MSNHTDCYKYSLLLWKSGCAPRIFLWNYGSAAYLLLADFDTIVPFFSVMCWTLNWYLSQCAHFSSSDPMWDRRDNALTPGGVVASLKLSLFFRRTLQLRDFPDGAGWRGSVGHVKGMRLWCSGLNAQGRRGGTWWAELGRNRQHRQEAELAEVAGNSQFGICLWFLTASFSKLGQIASNRAYFCFSTQVWCCSHCSHYILYIRYIIF